MYIINKISKDIYEIENFISDEEQSYFLDLANNGKDWHQNDTEYPEFWQNKNLTIDPKHFEIIYKRIKSLFFSYESITTMNNIQRYLKDQNMGPHRDHCLDDDNVKYGIVLYFNDNYLGGEICYSELDIAVKPKAKSLIIHGGEILHETSPIIGHSTRYFATTFVKGTQELPAILDPKIFN